MDKPADAPTSTWAFYVNVDGIDAAAERIKNPANAFLALKLSFVNEVAARSEGYGVEVEEVLS